MKESRVLPQREYFNLLREAHGCELPEAHSTWLGWSYPFFEYVVQLPQWGVTIKVLLPNLAVAMHLSVLHEAFGPDLPREHAEFYFSRYQVLVCDALTFALFDYGEQPSAVQLHLRERFGPMLGVAREAATREWAQVMRSVDCSGESDAEELS
ncbi:MAG TPA: hypothetical protein ENI87_09220 [bacterium]|nr:hypothetical protein [bacterium]